MPLVEIVKVFALILLPGRDRDAGQRRAPDFARRMDKPVRIGSAVILAVLVLGDPARPARERRRLPRRRRPHRRALLRDQPGRRATSCRRPSASRGPQAIASSMEIGVHNATLAIFVAVEVLDEVEISVPAAVYSLIMFVFAALWGSWVSRRVARAGDRVSLT